MLAMVASFFFNLEQILQIACEIGEKLIIYYLIVTCCCHCRRFRCHGSHSGYVPGSGPGRCRCQCRSCCCCCKTKYYYI